MSLHSLLATFQLTELIDFTGLESAAVLPTENINEGIVGNLSGWGAQAEGGQIVQELQRVEVSVTPTLVCSILDPFYTTSKFCAGSRVGVGACYVSFYHVKTSADVLTCL